MNIASANQAQWPDALLVGMCIARGIGGSIFQKCVSFFPVDPFEREKKTKNTAMNVI